MHYRNSKEFSLNRAKENNSIAISFFHLSIPYNTYFNISAVLHLLSSCLSSKYVIMKVTLCHGRDDVIKIAIAQIVIGTATIIVSTLTLTYVELCVIMPCIGTAAYTIPGIICGGFLLFTGMLGARRMQDKTKKILKSTLILSVLCSVSGMTLLSVTIVFQISFPQSSVSIFYWSLLALAVISCMLGMVQATNCYYALYVRTKRSIVYFTDIETGQRYYQDSLGNVVSISCNLVESQYPMAVGSPSHSESENSTSGQAHYFQSLSNLHSQQQQYDGSDNLAFEDDSSGGERCSSAYDNADDLPPYAPSQTPSITLTTTLQQPGTDDRPTGMLPVENEQQIPAVTENYIGFSNMYDIDNPSPPPYSLHDFSRVPSSISHS